MGLVVVCETSVVHQPAGGPLDPPASGDDREPFDAGVASDDFDVDAEAGAMVDGFRLVAGVGPRLGHLRCCGGDLGEQVDTAGVVADTRGGHPDGLQQAGGVDAHVALASCDFLARVDTLAGRWHVGGEVLMLCVSRTQALGSVSLSSASRAIRRSRPLSRSKTSSFCQAAK